jgi:CO/xanthine dehydrogenase Mo-binding subunit
VGDFYGAVAAETEELAEKAARAVKVEWEILPAYMDMGIRDGREKDLIHETVYLEDKPVRSRNNIACSREWLRGILRRFQEGGHHHREHLPNSAAIPVSTGDQGVRSQTRT